MPGIYNEVVFLYDKDKSGSIQGKIEENDIVRDVEDQLKSYGLTRTTKAKDQMSNSIVTQEIDHQKNVRIVLPALFLMIAALVLMMMLSRMIKRDRIKIGVLKAIGYSNVQVLSHYVKYSLLAGFLGGILGILIGMMLEGYVTALYVEFFSMPSYEVKFYYGFYALVILLSCGFCALSGALGARESMYITPAESMQSEAPKSGKRILLEKLPWFWRRLSFSRKMIVKNVFRNKKRSIFILAGVALTFGMMLFTLTMPQVVDDVMVKHFSEFQRMDYNISFYNPVTEKSIRDLQHEIPNAYIEGKIEYPFDLSQGNKSKTTVVVGIQEDTEFFELKDLNGKVLNVRPGGILLAENLAKSLRVAQGDQIKIETLLPGRKNVTITVQGVVKQSLGMNAYMEINDMGARLLERNTVNGVYLDSKEPDAVRKLKQADMVSTIMSTEEMKQSYHQFLGLIAISIGCLVFLSGILGFCIVYNATIVSLGEREMEFSSLRVLGFSKDEIFHMVLWENALLSVAGIILGVPLGFFMTSYGTLAFSTDIYTLYMEPTLLAAAEAFVLTVVFLLLSQVAAHQKVNRLDFLQALKNRAS